MRTVIILIAVVVLSFLGIFALNRAFPGFKDKLSYVMVSFAVIFFVCWVVMIFVGLAARGLRCPGCGNRLIGGLGHYCPECGRAEIAPGGWLKADTCLGCGKVFHRGKGASVKIRVCTHCGILLSQEGISA